MAWIFIPRIALPFHDRLRKPVGDLYREAASAHGIDTTHMSSADDLSSSFKRAIVTHRAIPCYGGAGKAEQWWTSLVKQTFIGATSTSTSGALDDRATEVLSQLCSPVFFDHLYFDFFCSSRAWAPLPGAADAVARLAAWRDAGNDGGFDVCRVDTHGNEATMRSTATRVEAEAVVAEFDAKHHKQGYFVRERGRPSVGGGAPRSLSVLSNNDDRLPRVLDALGFLSPCDFVLTSYGIGAEKPDGAAFAAARRRAAAGGDGDGPVAPHECLHIGDDLDNDVRGALAAGHHAVWVNRKGAEVPADLVPSSHDKLIVVDAMTEVAAALAEPLV